MGKVVIVTGATGGLGSAIVRKFSSNGANVVLCDIPKAQNAMDKLSEEIKNGIGQFFTYQADIRNYEELRGMVKETITRWGRIDVVVNTAGGTYSMLTKKNERLLVDTSEEMWDLVIDVNLKGSFNCIKAVAPQMVKQKDGHVILISSGTGIRPSKLLSSYAAAKAGVFGLMKGAARELGEFNIKVNAINPGLIPHWLGQKTDLPLVGLNPDQDYLRETMLGRLSNPGDLADFVVFISEKNNISGQIFNNDSRLLF